MAVMFRAFSADDGIECGVRKTQFMPGRADVNVSSRSQINTNIAAVLEEDLVVAVHIEGTNIQNE